ncbi:MAG: MFS transporter [Gemmatimonadota bacterium]|nr:MFS transporter [Gemmatimonadota bacterium]
MADEKKKAQDQALFTGEFIRVLFVHFLAMGSVGIYFFLPRFIRLTGGGEFLIGLIMGAPALTAVIFRLQTGSWVDRFGRKRLVILGLVFSSLASALPVFASGAGVYLLCARAIAGAAIVVYFTAVVTYVAEKAPDERRAEAIAIYGAGGFMALAISPYLCECLLEVLPLEPVNRFRFLFILAAVSCVLALVLSLRLSEDEPHEEQHLPPDPWHRVLRSPTMLYVVIPSLVFGAGHTSMFSFITDFTQVEGLGSPSSFFVSYSITVIALRVTTGRLLDRIDRRLAVTASLGAIAAGLFYASFSSGWADLVVVGILTGAGHGYIFPSLSTLTYESSQARNRGTSMALYMLGFDLSMMFVSPLLGSFAQMQDYFAMFRLTGVFLVVGLLLYLTGWRFHAPAAVLRSARGPDDAERFYKNAGALE